MKYYSIGEFANRIGKTIQPLRNWDKKNILKPSHVIQGGTRYYSLIDMVTNSEVEKIVVLYKDRLIRFSSDSNCF